MSSEQTVIERGTWQYIMNGDTPTHRRKKGTQAWKVVEGPPDAENEYKVCVVRQNQAEGEPKHWSLFIYQEGVTEGMLMQVEGDAVYMDYTHAPSVDQFQSDTFQDQFDLGKITETQRSQIWTAAHQIAPPRAATQAEVVENCQGWTIRLVEWLVQQGMVEPRWIESLRGIMDPL
ncbi:MAG: hypothetical protein M4579_004394 [Chaenotheca gracillima]|nr:MAG: hypothetical protein M4579_004394 [Chaenotheca gracillima]